MTGPSTPISTQRMPDFRVYSLPAVADPSEITLSQEESHHLIAVNRAEAGSTVVAFNGKGTEWICELLEPDKRAARLKVRFAQKARGIPWRITLGQALPLGGAMDSIVRKATEIGCW